MTYRELDRDTRARRVSELERRAADVDVSLRDMRRALRSRWLWRLLERLLPRRLEYVVMAVIVLTEAAMIWAVWRYR